MSILFEADPAARMILEIFSVDSAKVLRPSFVNGKLSHKCHKVSHFGVTDCISHLRCNRLPSSLARGALSAFFLA